MNTPLSELAKKLGIIRNEILVFSVIMFVLINLLSNYEFKDSFMARLVIMCVSLTFPIFAFVFYVYAYFRLPVSTQEYVFAKAGEKQVREHKQIQKSAKSQSENKTPRAEE